MTAADMETSRLAIRRLSLDCSANRAVARRTDFGRRLEQLARAELPHALEQALAPVDRAGGGLLFLRRLELELDLDLGHDARAIAAHWAEAIKRRLLAVLAGAGSASDVVFFPDRGRYLARFLADLAAGLAWQTWYYRSFDGLKVLPLSAALRTVLTDPEQDGAGALRLLEEQELERVVVALTAADAQRVLDGLACRAGGRSGGATAEADLALVVPLLTAGQAPWRAACSEPAHGALLLWLLAVGRAPGADAGAVAALAPGLALLMHQAGSGEGGANGGLPGLLRAGAWQAVAHDWSPSTIAALRVLVTGAGPRLETLLDAIGQGREHIQGGDRSDVSETRHTAFGNAFLLLPGIDELPLAAVVEDWPEAPDEPLALLRWAVLAACQGMRRRAACLRDPLMGELCGVSPRTAVGDLQGWLSAVAPGLLSQAHVRLVDWLRPDSTRLAVDRLQQGVVDMEIVRETRCGCWVWLLEPRGLFRADLPAPPPEPGDGQGTVAADAVFLLEPSSGAPADASPGAVDLLVALLAQVVLKRFCFRLPGFADSSVPYLHKNFLAMPARLVSEETRLLAIVGRVPLSLILNMTGAVRRTIALPAFSPLPIQLTQDPNP